MDLSRLATLKAKLVQAKEFSDIWTYFLDHFGEDPAFHALGERTRNGFIEAIFDNVAKAMFNGKIEGRDVLLTRLADHLFIHGGGIFGSHLVNVIYFEDIQVGVVIVVKPFSKDPQQYIRFTGPLTPPSNQPSAN